MKPPKERIKQLRENCVAQKYATDSISWDFLIEKAIKQAVSEFAGEVVNVCLDRKTGDVYQIVDQTSEMISRDILKLKSEWIGEK